MTYNWSSKRASIMSTMSRQAHPSIASEDSNGLKIQPRSFFDNDEVEPSTPSPSRKRYSLFGRNPGVDDHGAEQSSSTSASTSTWSRLSFLDKQSSDVIDAPQPVRRNSSRPFSRQSLALGGSKHEPIMRWIRRTDRNSIISRNSMVEDTSDPTDELAREMRKASISTPFNFQHVMHTESDKLPHLKESSDRDLTASFWAASMQHFPQGDIHGIEVCDLRNPRPASSNNASPVRASFDSSTNRLHPSPSMADMNDSPRPGLNSRTPSMVSLIADRNPPTMVHPAFRIAQEGPPSSTWTPGSGTQSVSSEVNRNLDVVPEEVEILSPPRIAGWNQSNSNADGIKSKRTSISSSIYSLVQPEDIGQDHQGSSVPSLSCGDSTDDEMDLASSTAPNSIYGSQKSKDRPKRQHDASLRSSPYEQAVRNISPRVSIARHQRDQSNMTIKPVINNVDSEINSWNPVTAFESPRTAPNPGLPEIERMTTLIDVSTLWNTLDTEQSNRPCTSGSFNFGSSLENPFLALPERSPLRRMSSAKTSMNVDTSRATNANKNRRSLADDCDGSPRPFKRLRALATSPSVTVRPLSRNKVSRSRTIVSAQTLHDAYAVPKKAEKFPVWV